jgi:hypothetical protein
MIFGSADGRRYVATTDSDHDHPIYANRAKDLTIDG